MPDERAPDRSPQQTGLRPSMRNALVSLQVEKGSLVDIVDQFEFEYRGESVFGITYTERTRGGLTNGILAEPPNNAALTIVTGGGYEDIFKPIPTTGFVSPELPLAPMILRIAIKDDASPGAKGKITFPLEVKGGPLIQHDLYATVVSGIWHPDLIYLPDDFPIPAKKDVTAYISPFTVHWTDDTEKNGVALWSGPEIGSGKYYTNPGPISLSRDSVRALWAKRRTPPDFREFHCLFIVVNEGAVPGDIVNLLSTIHYIDGLLDITVTVRLNIILVEPPYYGGGS